MNRWTLANLRHILELAEANGCDGVALDVGELKELLDLAERSQWISTKGGQSGPTEGLVLAIASGKPTDKITLHHAYCLAEYAEREGWILQEWPSWEGAEVSHWTPLPDPPEGEP